MNNVTPLKDTTPETMTAWHEVRMLNEIASMLIEDHHGCMDDIRDHLAICFIGIGSLRQIGEKAYVIMAHCFASTASATSFSMLFRMPLI